jgi:DNA gyrase/topoisomerase IV subunit B
MNITSVSKMARNIRMEVVGNVGKSNTGTTIRFWPNFKIFPFQQINVNDLKHN